MFGRKLKSLGELRRGRICSRKKHLEDVMYPTGSYAISDNNGDGKVKAEYIIIDHDDPCLRCDGRDEECPEYRD